MFINYTVHKNNKTEEVVEMLQRFRSIRFPIQSALIDIVIKENQKEIPFNLTYVALSRVKRVEDLFLHHVGQNRFDYTNKSKKTKIAIGEALLSLRPFVFTTIIFLLSN